MKKQGDNRSSRIKSSLTLPTHEIADWFAGERGRSAMVEAAQQSRQAIEHLDNLRRVNREQLDTPVSW